MDATQDKLVEFATSLTVGHLSNKTIAATRLRLIDSIGVALAARHAPPVTALQTPPIYWPTVTGPRLWGSGARTSPEHAALTNGTMVRFLDMNDAYTMTSTAHPSDNIAGLVALAEVLHKPIADLMLAIVISYEVQCRFCDVAPFHQNGWDQAIVGTPAAALAAAKLLDLDANQMRHALALAVTPHLPTYQTRRGTLSMWKNMAGPNGARLGLHAAVLAASGVTGPDAPFDGPTGLWQQTLGHRLDVPLPQSFVGHTFATDQSDIKRFPIRNACQLPTVLALEMHGKVDHRAIDTVTIWTDAHSFEIPSKDPALWHPTTRESADHSLPFCLAAALIDGDITLKTFERGRFQEADIRDLMARITIAFDPDFSRRAPRERVGRLVIQDRAGQTVETQRVWRMDDPERLPSAQEVFAKFSSLASFSMPGAQATAILDKIAQLSPEHASAALVDALVAL